MRRFTVTRTFGMLLGISILPSLAPTPAASQESGGSASPAEHAPANTIVVRYDIPLEALSAVSSSADLIAHAARQSDDGGSDTARNGYDHPPEWTLRSESR